MEDSKNNTDKYIQDRYRDTSERPMDRYIRALPTQIVGLVNKYHIGLNSMGFIVLVLFAQLASAIEAAEFSAPLTKIDLTPRALTQSRVERVTQVRACNISIPLPAGKSAAEATSQDFRRALKSYPDFEKRYRKFVNSPRLGPELERIVMSGDMMMAKYFFWRSEGVSKEAMEIFSEAFLIVTLFREGSFFQAASEADRVLKERPLKPKYQQLDEAEAETYFTKQTLVNIISAHGYMAYQELAAGNITEGFMLAVRYLQDREALLPILELFGRNEFDGQMLRVITERSQEAADNKLGSSARDVIIASWSHDGESYVTVAAGGGGGGNKNRGGEGATAGNGGSGNGGLHEIGGTSGNSAGGTPRTIKFGAAAFGATLISGASAQKAYRAYIQNVLEENSTTEMKLFNVDRGEQEYEVQFADATYKLTAKDIELLQAGKPLGDNEPLSRQLSSLEGGAAVEYSNPFMLRDSNHQRYADDITFSMTLAYAGARVYRDPLTKQTNGRVSALNQRKVGTPSDYVAVVADQSFGVSDWNVIHNISDELKAVGIEVQNYHTGAKLQRPSAPNKNVIVITGHSDEGLRKFIKHAGETGVFDGNFVIFNSCQTPITRQLAQEINETYGAIATLVFEGKIKASDVEDFLDELSKEIKASPTKSFVDTVKEKSRSSKLNGLWTISSAQLPLELSDHA